jgi:hypothetical protein
MSRMYENEEPIYMLQEDDNTTQYSFATAQSIISWDSYQKEQPYESKWFIAGRKCPVCKDRAEDHYTYTFCNKCKQLSDRNRYPFVDKCTCKGKQRTFDYQSEATETTRFILDEIQPKPLTQRKFKHQIRDYDFDQIPRKTLSPEEFEEPIQLSTDYWWLPTLQQPSERNRNEFNNYSDQYLCNSVWWMNTNPVTYC